MSSISLFRQLPKHILESICKYAIPISEDNRGPRPGIAMLRTDLFDSFGPEWREVALEHYFKNFTLAFNSGLGKVNSTHPLDEGFISVEEELQAIKSVNIYVALDDLVSGKAAHMLAQSKYSSLVFSSVKTLKIDINEFHKSAWTFDADDATSTPSLYQQLLVMFPEVTRVLLSKGSRSAANIVATNCEFEQFVLALFNCFSGVCATLDFKGGIKCMWNIEDIHSVVTEMTLSEDCYSEKTFKLVHKCAATLKVLDMHVYTGLGVLNVFTDAKGKPVEYPRLTTLNLNKGYGPGNESYVTCPQVLLPNLTHLTIEGGYPFDNAVLFRSTSKTLKYVGIFFNSEARGFVMDRPEEYWPYVFSISHNLRGLTMPSTFTYHDTLKKLLEGPAMENLNVTRFMANSRSSKPVQEEIDQAIKEEPFSQYSDKLKCLTYNGIPEGSETFAAKQVYW
ncbi:hypothetical protein GGI13_001464 [Coemansia sp. RSA 455]|nr:hypothetical protein GGI13_001464 [Coemansia sp. RSA 455]